VYQVLTSLLVDKHKVRKPEQHFEVAANVKSY
jgi:hypothetical protein